VICFCDFLTKAQLICYENEQTENAIFAPNKDFNFLHLKKPILMNFQILEWCLRYWGQTLSRFSLREKNVTNLLEENIMLLCTR
jgi:hypothetical protein